jgi:photosystem I P700 chlorophyll a apoprotein A2
VVALNAQIFLCHWGHLAIIFAWVSGNLFHIGWNGNYELWVKNPIKSMPIAHGIWDPHFSDGISLALSMSDRCDYAVLLSYSGIYNWLYTVGFTSVFHIYNFVIGCELLAVISILLAKVHLIYLDSSVSKLQSVSWPGPPAQLQAGVSSSIVTWPLRLFVACFDLGGLRLNFHIGVMIGFFSILWSGHLVHVAIPVSRRFDIFNYKPLTQGLYPFYTGNWGAFGGSLTFLGGIQSSTCSLYLTDIAHHHLAIGVLFVLSAHLYSSLYKGFGHRINDINSVNSGEMVGKSLHLQLSLACAGLGVCTSVVAQHMYSLTPYAYLSYDYVTTVALYVHHQYIASILMMAAFAHGGIFLVRDYVRTTNQDPVSRILAHKAAVISHLSWVSLYLGFHTLGLYVHNDTVVAFGEPEKQILIEPVFAQIIQESSSLIMPLGPGDLLAHHAIALGLHVTVLILLKGALDGRGSKLMPDKINFGYGFACDGPTRGGTCDISAWDSFYLAMFWMLNTDAWLMFYFHWKHLTLWQNTVFQFDDSSTYLNGWFRDYLWFNSAPLINGYNAFGANDLSILAWTFLGAHLCWATGFMFLISWRGYWEELIDTILYMHLKTPILYDLWSGIITPVALSIVQARFIGLVHFSVGFILTYAAFIIGATS